MIHISTSSSKKYLSNDRGYIDRLQILKVLNDPDKRKIYDQVGEDGLKYGAGAGGPNGASGFASAGGFPGAGAGGGFSFRSADDIFKEVGPFWNYFSNSKFSFYQNKKFNWCDAIETVSVGYVYFKSMIILSCFEIIL